MKYGTLAPATFIILLALTLQSCGLREPSPNIAEPLPARSTDLPDIQTVKSLLYSQYDEWKSVRYRRGGMSKEGIDCSGFVHLTFRSKFGIDLPRITDLQSEQGQYVDPDNMQAGDLIFFKTGLVTKHVGIYLEERKFMHASTRQGITISSLDEQYWSGKYWLAKRIRL